MRYWIQIHHQDGDCSAMVPDLPGCVAAGDSVDEVLKLIAEAIAMHLDSDARIEGAHSQADTTR